MDRVYFPFEAERESGAIGFLLPLPVAALAGRLLPSLPILSWFLKPKRALIQFQRVSLHSVLMQQLQQALSDERRKPEQIFR